MTRGIYSPNPVRMTNFCLCHGGVERVRGRASGMEAGGISILLLYRTLIRYELTLFATRYPDRQ